MNKIGTLAIVEIFEQLFSMTITVLLLIFWAGNSTPRACLSVIFGSGFGACLTITTLLLLKKIEQYHHTKKHIRIRRKLFETAVPLAIADNLKAVINTTENLMVPKRLQLFSRNSDPMAAFGMVCGMVFPILMFPAAILFGLAELLIPEMARCKAAGSSRRIQYLSEKSLLIAIVFGCLCGGILYIGAEQICQCLYKTLEASTYLRWFAILTPMLYSDIIVDAMTKGLGQQKKCVRNNIITSILDILLLFILLPRYGMRGYFISFAITHLLNFALSISLLIDLIGKTIQIRKTILCITISIATVYITEYTVHNGCIVYPFLFLILMILFGIIEKQDFLWFIGLIRPRKTI